MMSLNSSEEKENMRREQSPLLLVSTTSSADGGSNLWRRRMFLGTALLTAGLFLATRKNTTPQKKEKDMRFFEEEVVDEPQEEAEAARLQQFEEAAWLYRTRPKGQFDIFPEGAPGELDPYADDEADTSSNKRHLKFFRHITAPSLTPFFATTVSTSAPAIIIFPGGGFQVSAYEGEGSLIAERFQKRGVHAFVLKYRVPDRDQRPGMPAHWAALQDAQRAVTVVRASAPYWGVHPLKIGVCGFSAGGTLSALLSTHFRTPFYPAVDYADVVSPRPDFAVMVYPGDLVDSDDPDALTTDLRRIDGETPPAFLAHAADDQVETYMNSVTYFSRLVAAGVGPLSQLLIDGTGNHGFETNTVCTSFGTYLDAYRTRPQLCDWHNNVIDWMNNTLLLFNVDDGCIPPYCFVEEAPGKT